MPTNSYDVIVLGDDFAGLVTATLCARRGARVLLADGSAPPAAYELGPYTLPVLRLGPIALDSPAIRRVIDELNFTHLLKRRLRSEPPAFQLVDQHPAARSRIDVTADDDLLARELARELPDAAERFRTVCAHAAELTQVLDPVLGQELAIPPTGFWERRELARAQDAADAIGRDFAETADADPVVRAAVDAPTAMGGFADPSAASPIARARAFDLWRRSHGRLPGGEAELRDVFLEKFASHGGERRRASAEELVINWGKVTGVRLRDREELGAEHVVAAMPVAELAELLGKKAPKKLAQCVEQLTPAAYRYTLNLIVAEAGIPEGLADTCVVVRDPSLPLVGSNAFAIYRDAADDEARVPITIEARCPVPEGGQSIDDALADLRVQLREQLEEIMPFSREHVLVAHSPHELVDPEGVETAVALERPVRPVPVWRSELESHLGVSAVPYHVGVKRLTVASSQVLPGLGLEGQFAAGWSAARLALSGGKKKDYLKDEVLSR